MSTEFKVGDLVRVTKLIECAPIKTLVTKNKSKDPFTIVIPTEFNGPFVINEVNAADEESPTAYEEEYVITPDKSSGLSEYASRGNTFYYEELELCRQPYRGAKI